MTNRSTKSKILAHIAAIADKSKVEDSDFLFFKDGVYKGEWNPNSSPNQLPLNTTPNSIYLVSENGSYFGKDLLAGELVRYDSTNKPILVYSKYLPIPFFLSMLESEPPINSGGGFAYGGELDATPQQVIQVAVFNDLTNGTISNNVFTPTALGSALAHGINQHITIVAELRITYPTTNSNSLCVVGFATPSGQTANELFNTNPNSFVLCLGEQDNTQFAMVKYPASQPSMTPVNGISAGDSLVLSYDFANNTFHVYNETQQQTVFSESLNQSFALPCSLLIYGTVPVAFDIAGTNNPAMQVSNNISLPVDAVGKTYLITDANEQSVFQNKLLKTNDFVTFFDNEGTTDVIVNRLMSDASIQAIIDTAYQTRIVSQQMTVNDNNNQNIWLENANDFVITISGSYPTGNAANFNLASSCFTFNRLVRLYFSVLADVDAIYVNAAGGSSDNVSILSASAGTAYVIVYEKRGTAIKLLSKTQV